MAIRIIISDQTLTGHPVGVRDAIVAGYGSNIADQIEIRNGGITADWNYAVSIGAIAFVRSLTDLTGNIATALTHYPEIQGFMPLGSNSYIPISSPNYVPVIVTAGAGDTQNDTGYGEGLEFWDSDQDGNPAVDASSFANGTICGKLLYIKDQLNCNWWEARYRARMTATGLGTRTDLNGYGKIDKALAIAFAYNVPADPYLPIIYSVDEDYSYDFESFDQGTPIDYGNISTAYRKIVDNFGKQGWTTASGKKITYQINDDEKLSSKTFSMTVTGQSDVLRFLNMTNQTVFKCEAIVVYHFKTDADKFKAYAEINDLKDMIRNPLYWEPSWRQVKNENIEYLEKTGSYVKGRLTFDLHLLSKVWETITVLDCGTFASSVTEIIDFGGF